MQLVPRHLEAHVGSALDAARAVVLQGPRQCGKTTLARRVASERNGIYLTLDDDLTRGLAGDDPDALVRSGASLTVIDEFQLGGDRLLRAVKRAVDDDPARGRFLLTGSANYLAIPTLSESLAGRVRLLRLDPFSQAELEGDVAVPVDRWFDDVPATPRAAGWDRARYLAAACRGGYPEVVDLPAIERGGWFDSYVRTILERDLDRLADIRRAGALPRLLRWTAAVQTGELNVSRAARDLELDPETITTYLDWLGAVYLVRELPPWSRGHLARAIRRPKLHVADSGLAAALLGVDEASLSNPTAPATGPLLETFVASEVHRQIDAAAARVGVFHARDQRGHEIDLLLERADGAVVAIEVKATSSPLSEHARHLTWLRDRLDTAAPGTFRAGVLLHTGQASLTLADRIHVRPISTLWAPPAEA